MNSTKERTPNGQDATFAVRDTTNDGAIIHGLLALDEYRLKGRKLSGWAIDVGAHVGAITVALGLDNPELQIVAVEALSANADLLRVNVRDNGLHDRVHVVQAAADKTPRGMAPVSFDYEPNENVDAGYLHESRYIGNMLGDHKGSIEMVPRTTLRKLLEQFAIDRVSLLKIDCEGCEYAFLDTPFLRKVDVIVGEYHDNGSYDQLKGILDPTHKITYRKGDPIGLFEAVLR